MTLKQKLHTSSATYTFQLYPIGTTFRRIAGIYTFLILPPQYQENSTFYNLLYVGITNDFFARLKTHHKIGEASHLGMTHIGILRKSSGRSRKKIERNLLQYLNPPLNQTWL